MARNYVVGFVLVVSLKLALTNSDQPKVVLESGEILGLYKKSFSGFTFKSFEGIPYAESPIKENRFKEPILFRRKWLGSWNASNPSAQCLQVNHFIKLENEYAILGEEDCLYLNIYTRNNGGNNKNVIVHIHSGAFMFGTGRSFGPKYLMDKNDIVLVTFNYRLGPFGFLSTGDSEVPGNNGLKDQLCALKWVQLNIKAFGGDPSKVTLTGLSAGGASVHYMMLSPLSKGLFHRAVSFSGTALCPWALIHDVSEKSKKLAALLGCPTSPSEMVSCLKQRSGHVILQQIKHFLTWLYNPFTIFGPVIEKNSSSPIISEHPVDIMKQKKIKKIPWIISVVSEEALYPAAEFVFDNKLLNYLNKNWENLAPSLLVYNDTIPYDEHKEIARKIKEEYLKHVGFSTTSRNEILKMLGDVLFVAPAVNTAFLVARKRREPVYFYMYRQKNSISLSSQGFGIPTVVGTGHADDVSLIFDFKGGTEKDIISNEDKEMSNFLINILIHFAKTGSVPKEINWNPVLTAGEKFSYLDMKNVKEITMVVSTDKILGNPIKIAEIFRKDKSAKVGMQFEEVMPRKNLRLNS